MSERPLPPSWIEEVRGRLEVPPPSRLPPREVRLAAVLVPLFVQAGQLWTVLTKRTDHLPHHRSQIAFPGGTLESGETAWQAALRESEEELAIVQSAVLQLGQLDEAETPSGFRITPCVGAVPFPLETRPNEEEIAEVFSIPLLALSNPRLIEDRVVTVDGTPRQIRIYHIGGRQVWGLTARILMNLMERLGLPTVAEDTPLE